MDQISVNRIAKLHPKLRAEALTIWQEVENALSGRARARVTSTLRTFKEQAVIYNQGRTTPGSIVSNAKPGSSFHNFSLALDFALIVDTDGNGTYETTGWNTLKDYDGDLKSDWMEVVAIFEKHGWFWGGRFKSFKDMPHFQKTFGYTTTQLLKLYNAGKVDKSGYVLI